MAIDLEWNALPPGVYDCVIDEVDFKFGSTIDIVIDYRVPHDGRDYHVHEWLTLDADSDSPLYNNTAQGKGRLKQILAAYGEKSPPKLEPAEIVAALKGRALRVAITHKMINDLPVPRVTSILGKARQPMS